MTPKGFSFGGARCGLKNKRNDIGLIVSDREAQSAGVLTQNVVRAACVDHTRSVLGRGRLRAVVVNSGNANCCTGAQGVKDTSRMAELAASHLGVSAEEVAVGSTGVIGHTLDMTKVEKGILAASKKLGPDPMPFMEAILTTDLVEKWALRSLADPQVYIPGDKPDAGEGLIFGVAKGSGMIAPNMATMLSYIVTDLDTSALDLQQILNRAVSRSFNCMTVDGDTSTNDMLVLMANGASGLMPNAGDFEQALTDVCVSLAKQIARDGEGATKLIEVRVKGSGDPKNVARTIADSPLVKTALFGCDPNWGRILMAAGRAGVPFDLNTIRLALATRDEEYLLFQDGAPAIFDPKRVSAAMKSDYVIVDLRLGEGEEATIYTCDLGYGYVRINAEYHT
ncbi:MAG TPA: bifunctional glutamate N-acetyltransferase/amino-acid acetyltransferase ArgJ [Fimbriimonas sp.]|nr:bifunctional glutamate N-acetyltransferase/amino-acid acetyltransferase ArgJ [Fimbriimonas sp.]